MKCMMFGNSNTGIEKELAMEDYKVHTVRNRVAVLAVILTAVLLAVVFNVGLSLVRTVSLATAASPGPGADGNCVYGDYEILEKVRALPQVEWAAFVRRCSSTYLHNKEFAGVETRLFAADSVHYDKNKVELIVGKYPERPDEILVPDTMSEQLELGEKVGIVYPIVTVVRENGEDVEKEIPMTICGYFFIYNVIACTDPYGTSNIQHGNIVLNDEDFKSIYSGYEDFVTKICFDDSAKAVETGALALREERERYEAVREVIRDEGNLQMYFQSKYEDEINYTGKKRIMMIFGVFLAGIVGLIGISNVVSTVSMDVSARKLEYAAMQSIGMTKKQMERDIFGKYARCVFLASGLAAVGGAALTCFLGLTAICFTVSGRCFQPGSWTRTAWKGIF